MSLQLALKGCQRLIGDTSSGKEFKISGAATGKARCDLI